MSSGFTPINLPPFAAPAKTKEAVAGPLDKFRATVRSKLFASVENSEPINGQTKTQKRKQNTDSENVTKNASRKKPSNSKTGERSKKQQTLPSENTWQDFTVVKPQSSFGYENEGFRSSPTENPQKVESASKPDDPPILSEVTVQKLDSFRFHPLASRSIDTYQRAYADPAATRVTDSPRTLSNVRASRTPRKDNYLRDLDLQGPLKEIMQPRTSKDAENAIDLVADMGSENLGENPEPVQDSHELPFIPDVVQVNANGRHDRCVAAVENQSSWSDYGENMESLVEAGWSTPPTQCPVDGLDLTYEAMDQAGPTQGIEEHQENEVDDMDCQVVYESISIPDDDDMFSVADCDMAGLLNSSECLSTNEFVDVDSIVPKPTDPYPVINLSSDHEKYDDPPFTQVYKHVPLRTKHLSIPAEFSRNHSSSILENGFTPSFADHEDSFEDDDLDEELVKLTSPSKTTTSPLSSPSPSSPKLKWLPSKYFTPSQAGQVSTLSSSPRSSSPLPSPVKISNPSSYIGSPPHVILFSRSGDPIPFPLLPIPKPCRDRSPIHDLSPSPTIRTCFRIPEALSAAATATHSSSDILIELYARVAHSHREGVQQHFRFGDLFGAETGPALNGRFALWEGCPLYDHDSVVFLGEEGKGKMARAVGRMKREVGKAWEMMVLSVWEVEWEEIGVVRGTVCA